jgi:hypothetical protein
MSASAHDGADVPALDHRVTQLRELTLALAHDLAHLGMTCHDGHHPVDPGLADRCGDVGAGDGALALGDLLEAGDHAQKGRLATTRRAEKGGE